jgi:lysophospholipase L1-like esterase
LYKPVCMKGKKWRSRKPVKVLLYCVYLFVIVFIGLEIILRIYNPFHLRLKGDKIILPINQRQTITNSINPKLDPVVTNVRNGLGFRGPEWPDDGKKHLSIITIGGSTTECHFLNDQYTWPYVLGQKLADSLNNVWLNNAGMDGHSTYGHLIMLNDHVKKLHPSVVLFLTGINDVETASPSFHDNLSTKGAWSDFKHYIFENSEVLNLLLNLSRGWRAQRFNNTTHEMTVLNNDQLLRLPDSVINKRVANQKPYLTAYRSRLQQLADTCIANHILPVLVTQPNQFGVGKDSLTGADLELFDVEPGLNGKLIWRILEEYNEVVRNLGREKQIPVIDLAHLLPKNSVYFYDASHFTNAGAEKVASLLAADLLPVLEQQFPEYGKGRR